MYNFFLQYLLSNNPQKVIKKHGIVLRKLCYPLLKFIIPLTQKRKIIIVRREKNDFKRPVIIAGTHGFLEDVATTLIAVDRPCYILIGNLEQMFCSFDGISAWLAGAILVDRLDKKSRSAAKDKMVRALEMGANVILFPEGTWNKSPNELVSGLFPGVYDVSCKTGANVVVVATHREEDKIYTIVEKAFAMSQYDRAKGMELLKEKMATLKWELMEKYSRCRYSDLFTDISKGDYWNNYIDGLICEVKYYDDNVESQAKYKDKNIVSPEEAFGFMEKLNINQKNAFLLRHRRCF